MTSICCRPQQRFCPILVCNKELEILVGTAELPSANAGNGIVQLEAGLRMVKTREKQWSSFCHVAITMFNHSESLLGTINDFNHYQPWFMGSFQQLTMLQCLRVKGMGQGALQVVPSLIRTQNIQSDGADMCTVFFCVKVEGMLTVVDNGWQRLIMGDNQPVDQPKSARSKRSALQSHRIPGTTLLMISSWQWTCIPPTKAGHDMKEWELMRCQSQQALW